MRLSVQANLSGLNSFVNSFPSAKGAILSSIAKQGRELLRERYLSGQEIDLMRRDKDKRGRYLVSGKVTRGSKITFSSYPMNLFERGRRLRNGKREKGKRVIKVKFKGTLNSNLQRYTNNAYNRILKKYVDKV